MEKIVDIFGCNVFNDEAMREKLPKNMYLKLKSTIDEGNALDEKLASVVANAMKEWALEKGATHYTHWFQPMTGITAEKHDSFISPIDNSHIMMDFSGKELVKGEPDASSFPNGGMRSTFEARGYTAWDPTSYAFVKDKILCIPTVFCAYAGESLDKKTPLLKAIKVVETEALRVVKLFGNPATRVLTTVGPEQEYFLVDKEVYNQRKDLMLTGRTLFGAAPSKGQEMDDHYFGSVNPRVQDYMNDLNVELWKLGVFAKTEHKEVAPGQYELAVVYNSANLVNDQNQLTMEIMQKLADKHGLRCLLHEKPFGGINGSGKHNNWSLATNLGENLLEPGDSPMQNAQFLVFLMAIIKAVDEYQDLLRLSVASAGNDHRLGANEAPPAVVSIFIGEDLAEVVDALEKGTSVESREKTYLKIGVDTLPRFKKDRTDRNRTSPFAFTGNKFEFRMLGSSFSLACTNMMINTAVAKVLKDFADEMEKASDFHSAMSDWIIKTIKEHKRIIFNGNGYDDSWIAEAEKRGLLNLKNTVDALPHYSDAKNIALFEELGILTKAEAISREEILLENYSKTINIEGLTMSEMIHKDVLPSVVEYMSDLSKTIINKKQVMANIDCSMEETILTEINDLAISASQKLAQLDKALVDVKKISGCQEMARFYCDHVLKAMDELRIPVDDLESKVAKKYWSLPTYEDMLFL